MVGVGEVHATTDGPAIPTTLSVFTKRLLPIFAPTTTDLVIETWRLDGACVAKAGAVATQVQADTRRPEETKDELSLLVEASLNLGVQPHDLVITCDEYAAIVDPTGEVDYGALLTLVTGKLGDYSRRGFETPGASLVIYGGAVHNDLTPRAEAAAYSYAVATPGFIELDLYAPELIRGNATMVEPGWAPLLDLTGPDRVILHARGPQSFVLLLETAPSEGVPGD